METTEYYESKFISSASSSESSSVSGDITNYYNKKCNTETSEPSVGTECETKKEWSNESEKEELLDCISVTVPYEVNTRHGFPNKGSLVFIDYEGLARPLYRVPGNFTLDKFIGSRFIAASSSLGNFNIVRTSNFNRQDGITLTSTILDQMGGTNNTITDASDSNTNYGVDSRLNVSYVVGDNEIYGIRHNGVRFVSRRLPPSNKSSVQVVAVGANDTVYTAAKVGVVKDITIPNVVGVPIVTTSLPREFHNLSIVNHIGYILHMTANGIINALLLIKADELVFRGMYYFNDRLVITGSYKGQMATAVATRDQVPSFEKVATRMPATTSFIIALDSSLSLVWYRLITCDNTCYNIIGDVTINKLGQIFTTCRFKGNLALSDYNSTEIDKCIQSDDEAMVIIGLQGEMSSCGSKVSSWWRMLPVGPSMPQVSDYISMTNNGYDIFISAYTNASLSKNYLVSDHYFVAGFTPTLVDLFYHPISNSLNKYNSRIIAYSNSTLFTGSTTWNNFYVHPFGLIAESFEQSGYFLTISLRSPKLVGIVIDRNGNRVDVQFKGYTNIYKDAKVGKDYYIDLSLTTETAAVLTPNMNNQVEPLYYGTAVKNGIILIS